MTIRNHMPGDPFAPSWPGEQWPDTTKSFTLSTPSFDWRSYTPPVICPSCKHPTSKPVVLARLHYSDISWLRKFEGVEMDNATVYHCERCGKYDKKHSKDVFDIFSCGAKLLSYRSMHALQLAAKRFQEKNCPVCGVSATPHKNDSRYLDPSLECPEHGKFHGGLRVKLGVPVYSTKFPLANPTLAVELPFSVVELLSLNAFRQ